MAIDKTLISINNGNLNSVADAAGDQLNYKVTVSNLGVLTLTNVSVVDPSTGLDIKGLTLVPGESKVVETSYVITQADLDNNGGGNGYLANTSVADSNETMPVTDLEPVVPDPKKLRRTAWILGLVAVGVYAAFMLSAVLP